jgi:Protein of unknown function (DUF3040)
MDDDPVLRELGAELERDDPELAALLSGSGSVPRRHRHWMAWTLLALTIVCVGVVLAPAVTLGVLAMLLVLASPLVACWWCALPDDGPAPSAS